MINSFDDLQIEENNNIPYLLIAAGITVAAGAIAWVYNKLTAAEEQRHKDLWDDINSIKEKISNLKEDSESKLKETRRKSFLENKEKILNEINFYRKEKDPIKKDLINLYNATDKELKNEWITPYNKRALKWQLNRVEDAKKRYESYWKFLEWYEGKLADLESKEEYDGIDKLSFKLGMLPEDYLYVGKLILIEKEEIDTFNQYGQKLQLSSKMKNDGSYSSELEKKILDEYEKDIPLLITYEKKGLYFDGSVARGEIYVNHILPEIPFEVEVVNSKRMSLLYKGTVQCSMKDYHKEFPLKRYREKYKLEVYPLEWDLILNKLQVSEKRPKDPEIKTNIPIIIVFEEKIANKITELEENLELSNYKINVIDMDIAQRLILLRIGKINIHCELKEDYLNILNVDSDDIKEVSIVEIPFKFEILSKESFDANRNLYIGLNESYTQLIAFVQSEFNYRKDINEDFDFFEKWSEIVEYQIDKERYNEKEFEYENIEKIDEYWKLNLNLVFESLNELEDKDVRDYQNYNDKNKAIVALEAKFDEKSNYEFINIGVIDDTDYCTFIKLYPDGDIKRIILSDRKKFLIRVQTFQGALYRQRKALFEFKQSKIINDELKKLLISPHLIQKNVDLYEEENFDRNIAWKNPNLTENQKNIIKQALLEKNIFIIQGPPGTGKTTVIKEIAYQFLKNDNLKKLLIVSQQNVAVDNALVGIYKENKEEWFDSGKKSFVRIARDETKVMDELKIFTIENWFDEYKNRIINHYRTILTTDTKYQALMTDWWKLINKNNFADVDGEVIEVLINSHQIIGATCVGLANKRIGLDLIEFDLAIIDEAGRATPPELLIPMLRARKFILIGDHYQLPPNVGTAILDDIEEIDFVDKEFLEKSFFERLYEKSPVSNKGRLTEQFRMPNEVGDLVSRLFYNEDHYKLKNGEDKKTDGFVYDPTIEWLDVKGKHKRNGTSLYNIEEIDRIFKLLKSINGKIGNNSKKSVAIITPYTAQKRKIKEKLEKNKILFEGKMEIEVDTVDHFQGCEAQIVIYSVVRINGNLSFILDRKRLNVAISRTKENLFFVGDKNFLYNATVEDGKENLFKEIVDFISAKYPSSICVKISNIINEMRRQSRGKTSYLHKKTGEIITISDKNEEINSEILTSHDYILLPNINYKRYDIMQEFCLTIDDKKVREIMLHGIDGKGAFKSFKMNIEKFKITECWEKYENEAIKQIAIDWCEKYKTKYTNE